MTPGACAHCGAPDVVRGDGGTTLVCPRCIRALGRVAADPWSAHVQVRERLRAEHGTAVALIGDRWDWIAPAWAGTGGAR